MKIHILDLKMARIRCSELFFVLAVWIIIQNCVTIVQSDDTEQEINEELYKRQKHAFGDSLGYGYLGKKGSKSVPEELEDTALKDKGSHIEDTNKLHVRKRSAGGSDPYGLLAGISGGSVIHTDKDNISSAVDILTTSTLANPVILTRISLKLKRSGRIGRIEFCVDKSLTKITFEIKTTCCKPRIVVIDATGKNFTSSSPNVTVKVDTDTMMYLEVAGTFIPGNWTLTLSATDSQNYDVTVHGSSLIDFDLAFSDSKGNTVSGQPIPDSNSTYVKITPLGADLVSNWTNLLIKAVNGTLLQRLPLGALRGSRTSKAFLLPVEWPNMDVHVGVLGLDKDGNTFTREQRTLIQPLGVRLLLDNTGAEFINSCNTPFILSFTVSNTGSRGNFTCQISSDNKHFFATVTPESVSLASLGTARGHASVTLKTTPKSDKTVQLVISVLDSVMKAQYVTKTLIAKDVTCPDTATHTYVETTATNTTHANSSVTPITTSNDATASTNAAFGISSLIVTLLMARISAAAT